MGGIFFWRKKSRTPRISFDVGDIGGPTNEHLPPMFTRSTNRQNEVSFEDFFARLKRTVHYMSLERMSDAETARSLARRFYDMPMDGGSNSIAPITEATLAREVNVDAKRNFARSVEKLSKSRMLIYQMHNLAARGQTRAELADPANQTLVQETEFQHRAPMCGVEGPALPNYRAFVMQGGTLMPQNQGIAHADKVGASFVSDAGGLSLGYDPIGEQVATAADWVVGSSPTLKNKVDQTVVQGVRGAIFDVIYNRKDMFSVETINGLDQVTGKKEMLDRPFHRVPMEAFYGGTTAGRFLQKLVLERARQLRGNAAHQPYAWIDIAVFMMAGHILAQAYPDANHRVSRLTYVCLLLQKGMPLILPDYEWIRDYIFNPGA